MEALKPKGPDPSKNLLALLQCPCKCVSIMLDSSDSWSIASTLITGNTYSNYYRTQLAQQLELESWQKKSTSAEPKMGVPSNARLNHESL